VTAPDLPAFLLARYSDELRNLDFVRDFIPDEGNQGEYLDPARVLADVEAKRRIVALHSNRYDLGECAICAEGWMDLTSGEGSHSPLLFPCPTLRALASVYRDAPDFDPSWAL
jgi:hypothetical protein